MTKFRKTTGSKYIRKDTFVDPSQSKGPITNRRAYVIVDNKHKTVFHKSGHIIVFYSKKKALGYLQNNPGLPESWRVLRIQLKIENM